MLTRFVAMDRIARPSINPKTETTTLPPEVEQAELDALKAEQDKAAASLSRYPVVEAIATWDHTCGERYSDVMFGGRLRSQQRSAGSLAMPLSPRLMRRALRCNVLSGFWLTRPRRRRLQWGRSGADKLGFRKRPSGEPSCRSQASFADSEPY